MPFSESTMEKAGTDMWNRANANIATMRFALAQLDQTLGDLPGNARQILEAAERAHAAGVRCIVTPELSICGYPPEDLVLRPSFVQACRAELDALAAKLPPLAAVIGVPLLEDGIRYN